MNKTISWKPSASVQNLLKRALIISKIRQFFTNLGLVEVETPCMSHATVTDINLFPFETSFSSPNTFKKVKLYLMTSPEFHMKRLLASGIGPIFQLFRSFRNKEIGRYHNPEFTILEWYRPHYNMDHIMHEVDDLLQIVLNCRRAEKLSYQKAFQTYLNIDPLSTSKIQLREIATRLGLNNVTDNEEDKDVLLQLLFIKGVEPKIGKDCPAFIYHFPASQASLAKINSKDNRVTDRFEVYYKGIELANGFNELTDAYEQKCRFEQDNQRRALLGLPQYPIDNNLLEALKSGMPDSSGVALGVDRLIMLALDAKQIDDVISFASERS